MVLDRILALFHRRSPRSAHLFLSRTMTKHSKNNTASSIFSYAEYKKLDYGTKRVLYLLQVLDGRPNTRIATSGERVYATLRLLLALSTTRPRAGRLPGGPPVLQGMRIHRPLCVARYFAQNARSRHGWQ